MQDLQTDSAWYDADETKPMSDVTVAELEQLCAAIFDQRVACDEKQLALKMENEKLSKLEGRMAVFLKETGRSNYKSKLGSIGLTKKRSWALPKTPEERQAFFGYLKQLQIFDSMITVHSATYNAFLKEQYETAEREGRSSGFQIPGVGEPSEHEIVTVRKGK